MMDTEEQKALFDALQRVERSLDERFEKDVSLYIPVEAVEDIKEQLYKGNYDYINNLYKARKYSAEILTNVVIKNAWLMPNKKYAALKSVINECNINYLKSLMSEYIFENRLDMAADFRNNLIELYLKRALVEDCQKLLDDDAMILHNPYLRAICVRRSLAKETPLNKYKCLNQFAHQYPAIISNDKCSSVLKDLFRDDDFDASLCQEIFDDQFSRNSNEMFFWRNCLPSSGIEFILQDMVNYFEQNPENKKKCRNLCNRIAIFLTKEPKLFVSYFVKACQILTEYCQNEAIRKVLVKTKDEDKKQILIDALTQANISVPGDNDTNLPDLSELEEDLGEAYITPGKMRYLTTMFNIQYPGQFDKLNEMAEWCGTNNCYDNFVEFCLILVETCRSNKYLLYTIENIAVNHEPKVDNRVLQYIEEQDILRAGRLNEELRDKVSTFVKEHDFDLFCRLTE